MTSLAINKRVAKQEKVRRTLQTNFTKFKKFVYPQYADKPHLRMLDDLLTQVSLYAETEGAEGIGRAIVEMPPRHGKSVTISRLYPTWHLGNHTSHRVMLVGYGASLAEKHSRYARNLMKTRQYEAVFSSVDSDGIIYKKVELASDSKSVQEWDLEATEGGASALGVGGAATGKGANILIIDDPYKNRAEAESQTIREKVWDSYTDDLSTRLEPGGAIIIVHTRWHTDDLIGRLLSDESEEWHRLRLPALAEENDILGREIDEPLWVERFDFKWLNHRRNKYGEYSWASLYQQRPMPSKAGLFDTSKIKIIDPSAVPDLKSRIRFYDLAVTAKKTSDYTAGCLLGIDKDENAYILHMYRVQKNPVNVKDDIIQQAQIDGTDVRIRLEAENSARVQLDYMLREPALHNYSLDIVKPDGDKYTRATPFASRVNAEKVFMVRGAWNRALLDEMAVFPMGANDDQVDALSGAWHGVDNWYPERIEIPNPFGRF